MYFGKQRFYVLLGVPTFFRVIKQLDADADCYHAYPIDTKSLAERLTLQFTRGADDCETIVPVDLQIAWEAGPWFYEALLAISLKSDSKHDELLGADKGIWLTVRLDGAPIRNGRVPAFFDTST